MPKDVIKPALPAQARRLASPNADDLSLMPLFTREEACVPLRYSEAVNYVKLYSRSHGAVIRVYDEAGNVIETHEQGAISKSGSARQLLRLFRTVCGSGFWSILAVRPPFWI